MNYDGWKNYETWLVALWIGNNESVYRNVQDLLNRDYAFKHNCEKADALKEMIEEFLDFQEEASLRSDLLNAALSEVDWMEIVESYAPQ